MIRVSVKREDARQGVVIVADEGVGYIQVAETRRHGVGLVRRLLQQMGGTLDVAASAGTVWTLCFPTARDTDVVSSPV